MARKLILKNDLSPGDIVMMTAAVRDLHLSHPGEFITDVNTTAGQLWENSPYVTKLDESDPDVEVLMCRYPLIHQSNEGPWHFIHGMMRYFDTELGTRIVPTRFGGDIHLSNDEKNWMSQVQEMTGNDHPFWIINAGGKNDFTIKWWSPTRYQRVVDHFRGRIQFVQVGEAGHAHQRLRGVIDLVGKTDTRQLVRLMHHAAGVLCPVTFVMHLCAAVETKLGMSKTRPCVVVAGGREPSAWEAYTNHRFLHTCGALPCCDNGGCWKARTVPLYDGEPSDESLCLNPVLIHGETLPKCMNMIETEHVIAAIESYFIGGVAKNLPAESSMPHWPVR